MKHLKFTIHSLWILLLILLLSCKNQLSNTSISTSNSTTIIDIKELTSPYTDDALYQYIIEGSMAFTSDIVAIKILPKNLKNKNLDKDHYIFKNHGYPFSIKWISKDSLLIKCLTQGTGLKETQPYEEETVNWKNWILNIKYYSMFSSGLGGKYQCDSILVDSNNIIFFSMDTELKFDKNDVQICLDSTIMDLQYFRIDTFNKKLGISFSSYQFKLDYNLDNLENIQTFIKKKL